jgi:hypothetical protein
MTEFRVHMRYKDQFGTHNVTEYVTAETAQQATVDAVRLVENARAVMPWTVSVSKVGKP